MNNLKRLLHVAAFLATIPISVNGNDCTKEEFRCDDGSCIPLVQVCDISIDCQRGEDEDKCSPTSCPEGLIRCFDECKYECETTTRPSDNQIISTTPLMNELDTNNLIYLLLLMLIIPIVFIIFCIKYHEEMRRTFIYHLTGKKNDKKTTELSDVVH